MKFCNFLSSKKWEKDNIIGIVESAIFFGEKTLRDEFVVVLESIIFNVEYELFLKYFQLVNQICESGSIQAIPLQGKCYQYAKEHYEQMVTLKTFEYMKISDPDFDKDVLYY